MSSDRHAFIHDSSHMSEATFGRYDKLSSEQEGPPQHELLKVEDPSAPDRRSSNKENSLLSVSGGKDRNNKLSSFYQKQSSNQPTASSFVSEDFREKGINSDIRVPELVVNNNSKLKLGGVFRQGSQRSQPKLDKPMLMSTIRMDTLAISDGKSISTPGPPGMPNPRTSTIITFSVNKGDLLSRAFKVEGFHQPQARNFNQTMSNKYGGETMMSPQPNKANKRGSAVLVSSTKNGLIDGIGVGNNPNLMKAVLMRGFPKEAEQLGSRSGGINFGMNTQKDSEVIDEDDEEEFLDHNPSLVEETIQMEDSKLDQKLQKEMSTPDSRKALNRNSSWRQKYAPRLQTGMSGASSKFTGSSQSAFHRARYSSGDGFGKGEIDSMHPANRGDRVSVASGPFNMGQPPSFHLNETGLHRLGSAHMEEEMLSLRMGDTDNPEALHAKLDSVYDVGNHLADAEYKPFREYMQKIGVHLEKLLPQPSTRSPSFSLPPANESSSHVLRSPEFGLISSFAGRKEPEGKNRARKCSTHEPPESYPVAQAATIRQSNRFKNRFKLASRLDNNIRTGFASLH